MRLGDHWHPWEELRKRPDLTLIWCDRLPGDRLGATDGTTIWLQQGLDFIGRRSVLSHELRHIIRRLTLACVGPDEVLVEKDTARAMIRIDDLIDVLGMRLSWGGAAAELAVDLDVLRTRMQHLHPAERGIVREALGSHGAHPRPLDNARPQRSAGQPSETA